jgi:DNA-binding transcriptional regulator YhcF (GntR family)
MLTETIPTATTKYRRIVAYIEQVIEQDGLAVGEQLPSINQLRADFGVSRVTVLQALRDLMTRGIIQSSPGKGYFVQTTAVEDQKRIFLLFDEFSPYKEILYTAIKGELAGRGALDIYFHHFNRKVFERLITDSAGSYTDYIIMPMEYDNLEAALAKLPSRRVYILDQGWHTVGQKYPSVCQDFFRMMSEALTEALPLVRQYDALHVVYQNEPEKDMIDRINNAYLDGIRYFCEQNHLPFHIHHDNLGPEPMQAGQLFVILNDWGLIDVIKKSRKYHLSLGRDIGIIAINESPIREVIEGGIASISTDFQEMGREIVRLLFAKKAAYICNKHFVVIRDSLGRQK